MDSPFRKFSIDKEGSPEKDAGMLDWEKFTKTLEKRGGEEDTPSPYGGYKRGSSRVIKKIQGGSQQYLDVLI